LSRFILIYAAGIIRATVRGSAHAAGRDGRGRRAPLAGLWARLMTDVLGYRRFGAQGQTSARRAASPWPPGTPAWSPASFCPGCSRSRPPVSRSLPRARRARAGGLQPLPVPGLARPVRDRGRVRRRAGRRSARRGRGPLWAFCAAWRVARQGSSACFTDREVLVVAWPGCPVV